MRLFTSIGFSRTSKPATSARAVGGRHEAGQHAHGRGFTGAVGPQEPHDLPFFNLERDVIDRDIAGVSLGKSFDFDHMKYSGRARPLFVSVNRTNNNIVRRGRTVNRAADGEPRLERVGVR